MSNFNINDILQYLVSIGKTWVADFHLNETDKEIYTRVILYFFQDEKFEKINPNYNLNKGLLIMGNVGVGKSIMLLVFRKFVMECLQNRVFTIEKTIDIAGNFSLEGYPIIQQHGDQCFSNKNGRMADRVPRTKCYDDLGSEEQSTSFYGSKINVMEKIILKRYDFFITHKMKTFITTNLSPSQLESKYGERVMSRLREMMNPIYYPGEDRRK